ncbi:MAG: NADPH-dependent F420 reductase [Promethearchaeota archaeon]
MKIGIIGTGNVGTSLGKIWAENGQDIFFGSRDPVGVTKLVSKMGLNIQGGTYNEAAQFGEVVLLAIPWSSVEDTIGILGDLNGKIIIDCTNAVAPKLGGLLIGLTTSAAEKIAEWANGANVVKGFNAFDPEFINEVKTRSPKPSTFICGDDSKAKSLVKELGQIIGYDVVDCGPLKNARFLEPLAMLWIELAYTQGMGPGIAFKLLHHRKLPE